MVDGEDEQERPDPQSRARVVRARLLQAAEQSFCERGYDRTSMDDIARSAGVAIETLYSLFADTRALLLDLIDRLARRLAAVPYTDLEFGFFLKDDARAAIDAYLHNTYEKYRKRPSIYIVALAMAGRDDEVRQRYQRVEQLATEWLCALIEYGQKNKLMRASADAKAAAFVIHNSLDMAAAKLLLPEHSHRVPEPERVLRELCELICLYILEPQSA